MPSFKVKTTERNDMVDITDQLQDMVSKSGISRGMVTAFVPHTTAGITINEAADPDVVHDMLAQLDTMVPWEQPFYQHREGNSAAHVKASMMGSSVTIVIHNGNLLLGRWQGVWFCEFDGPRSRQVIVRIRQNS